jgi:hypothetical protein
MRLTFPFYSLSALPQMILLAVHASFLSVALYHSPFALSSPPPPPPPPTTVIIHRQLMLLCCRLEDHATTDRQGQQSTIKKFAAHNVHGNPSYTIPLNQSYSCRRSKYCSVYSLNLLKSKNFLAKQFARLTFMCQYSDQRVARVARSNDGSGAQGSGS